MLPNSLRRVNETLTTEDIKYRRKTGLSGQWSVIENFDSTYYSGINVTIFFEQYLISEIINLQYQVVENQMPFYGYADYIFRHLASGTRMIQGSFAINFTKSYYISELLNQLNKEEKGTPIFNQESKDKLLENFENDLSFEDLLSLIRSRKEKGVNRSSVHRVARQYKDRFWGRVERGVKKEETSNPNKPLFNINKGFTLIIKYGDPLLRETTKISTDIAPKPYVGTLKALTNVNITGVGEAIDDSGKNILEVYQFIAKDLVSG